MKTAVTSGFLVDNYILMRGTCLHLQLLQALQRKSGISSELIYTYTGLNCFIFHKQ